MAELKEEIAEMEDSTLEILFKDIRYSNNGHGLLEDSPLRAFINKHKTFYQDFFMAYIEVTHAIMFEICSRKFNLS